MNVDAKQLHAEKPVSTMTNSQTPEWYFEGTGSNLLQLHHFPGMLLMYTSVPL
jgi:hypothetical protein